MLPVFFEQHAILVQFGSHVSLTFATGAYEVYLANWRHSDGTHVLTEPLGGVKSA